MILTADKAKLLCPTLADMPSDRLEMLLDSIEQTIRSYTNNSFQNRKIRGCVPICEDYLLGCIAGIHPGDTIQISNSFLNDGLHVVKAIDPENNKTILEKPLEHEEGYMLVTKVVYPADVVQACLNLLSWESENREKVGIKEETLSRHSVTYYDQDSTNTIQGYPVSLLGCLKPYRKARF